jgi:hypothetical protein
MATRHSPAFQSLASLVCGEAFSGVTFFTIDHAHTCRVIEGGIGREISE